MDEQSTRQPSPKGFSSTSSFTVMVCFPVSTSVITALTVRSVSSFNEPHPDRKRKRVNKHRAIPIPLTFLCSNVLSSCFLLRNFLKSTRHFPACSHNFPKAGEARFQGRSRLFRLLGKLPYLGESRRILMAVSSKTSSKTRFCYAATRRISSAAVQPSIWA